MSRGLHGPLAAALFCVCGAWIQAPIWAQPSPGSEESIPASGAPQLQAIPEAPLEGLEDAVRRQLSEKRRQLDEATALPSDPAELVPLYGDLGRLYLLYDRPETAAACFRNVTLLVPKEPNAWYYLGVVHQDAGRFDMALEAFAHTLDQRSRDLPALLRRGEILLQLRRLDDAAGAFEAAAELDPAGAAVNFGLGRLAAARRNWPEAVELFRLTLEKQPDADSVYHPLGLALRRLGDIEGAKKALAKAGPSAPIFDDPLMGELFKLSATSRSYFIEGNRARRRGLTDLAESHYRKALELDETDASVHYNLGTLLGESGRVDEAEHHFRAAVTHDPSHRDARFNLAVGLRAKGDLGGALEAFATVVRLDPNDQSARLELGATHYAQGDRDRGFDLWRQVADALLEGSSLHGADAVPTLLQLVRYRIQAGQAQDLDVLLSRAEPMASGADAAALFMLKAELAGSSVEVERHLTEALAHDPRSTEAAVRLAGLFCGQGRQAQAVEVLEAALVTTPEARALQEALARHLASTENPDLFDPERALKLARAIFERTQGPLTAETMAMAIAANGDFTQATQWQRRLVHEFGARAPQTVRQRLEENLARFEKGRRAAPTCAPQ